MTVDTRSHMLSRLFADRVEWAVNAQENVLLSVPYALREPPSGVGLEDAGCFVLFEGGARVEVQVPIAVAPFLSRAATVLVVTLKDGRIISETDVYVRREAAQQGVAYA